MQGHLLDMAINAVIEDLGATGLLVVGLYFFLGKPLKMMNKTLEKINDKLYILVRGKRKYNAKIKETVL